MDYLQTNDPILIRRRNGQSGDELKEKIDHITVVNNVAILHEVPNKFERVYIEGLVEKITDYYNMDSIKENEYIVDYNYGYVYFNPVQDNKTFVAKYKGEGMILYPASRIYDAKDVNRQGTAKTLQELIDAGRDSLKAVGDLHGAIETANRLYTQITENVKNIGDIDKQLNGIVEQGKDLLRQLTEKISQANKVNSELKETSLIASNKKNELDNSIQQGTNIDEKLKNTSLSANSINDTLNGNILEGKNKIKEINDKISETDNKLKEISSNERIRQSNEETRENEENLRKSNENKRIESENTRENKFKLMENTINDFSVCEEYSNRKQYKKYNRVTFNGSCYECIKDCSNIQPVDKSYWICIAKKGRDGDGSGDMLMSTYDTNKDGVVDNAERVNGHTVECNVPQNAKFTDTIYDDTKIKEEVNRILYARGQRNGFAVLDENGKIPKENIPTDISSSGDMKKSIYDTNGNGIVDNAEKVNGYTVDCNVPRNAKFTDTIYNDFSIKQDIRKLKTDSSSTQQELNQINDKIKNISVECKRKTYDELKQLVDSNQLKTGERYILTDYKTKYQQPTTNIIKEVGGEELILTALNSNTFEPIVFSLKYPQDTIWYDFNDNVCEDHKTSRNGFITRRYDHISKNNCPQDWRHMLWSRDGKEYLTFDRGCVCNYIGDVDQLHNNVFGNECKYNSFGNSCFNNTFYNSCYGNTFCNSCYGNTFNSKCFYNTFSDGCHYNTFGSECYDNTFGSECYDNILGNNCTSNNIGNACYNNTFGDKVKNLYIKGLILKNLINITELQNKDYTITIEKTNNNQYIYWYFDSSNKMVVRQIP